MNRIEVKNLHFSYTPGEEVIKNINIVLDRESTAIIGQNGAGKTTFVKLLKGLLKPCSGDIFINGKNTRDSTAAELAKDIGLVFQNPNDQIFKSKVIDEVMFGPLNIGQTQEAAMNSSMEALKMVGLKDKASVNPYDLGLSERKLVSIASILAMNTSIIIFDEPTIGQDYEGKERIKGIIRNLREEGKLVITIIHDMDFVAETFERVVVFQKGELLTDGTAKEVFSKSSLLYDAYLEPPNVTQLCQKLGYSETFLSVSEFVEYKRSNIRN